jgi:transcription initiation factor TFIIB
LSRGHRSNRREEGIALGELRQFSERLSVPDAVKDEAARICMRGLGTGMERWRSSAQITASSIYAACREKGIPTTLGDVAAASGVRRDEIAKCYRLLVNEFDLKIPVADPAEYVAVVAARAKVDPCVQQKALEILSKAKKAGLISGRDPIGVAASALYLASLLGGESLTQGDVAEAAGVAEVTVRNEYRRMKKVLRARPSRLIPEEIQPARTGGKPVDGC